MNALCVLTAIIIHCPPPVPTVPEQCVTSAAWGHRGDGRRWVPEFPITWAAASPLELVPVGIKLHLQLFVGGADIVGVQVVAWDPVLGTSALQDRIQSSWVPTVQGTHTHTG